MHHHKILFLLSALLAIYACDNKKVFDNYIALENNTWSTNNILEYNINISDTTQANNMLLNIRNNNTYPYSNLYLFITISDPMGKNRTDTLEVRLADDTGKWLGKGIGSTFHSDVMLLQSFRFQHTGIYKIEVEQGMRTNELKGIIDVGIRVEKN
jgi:gliding motility-associated lipoprotein GldH